MERSLDTWAAMDMRFVVRGSKAQHEFALRDAQLDIAELAALQDKLITALEEATEGLGPLAGKVFNDNGKFWYADLSEPATASECKAAYFARKRARTLIAQAKGE